MEPVFRKTSITSIAEVLPQLRPVRFPEATQLTAKEVIELKRDIRCNCELLIQYAYVRIRTQAMLSGDASSILNQLLRDAHEVRRECGKVSVSFLGPRNKRIITKIQAAYEEMRLAAILVCQQSEPTLMDSLTVAL
jgi:hypothetical protein